MKLFQKSKIVIYVILCQLIFLFLLQILPSVFLRKFIDLILDLSCFWELLIFIFFVKLSIYYLELFFQCLINMFQFGVIPLFIILVNFYNTILAVNDCTICYTFENLSLFFVKILYFQPKYEKHSSMSLNEKVGSEYNDWTEYEAAPHLSPQVILLILNTGKQENLKWNDWNWSQYCILRVP